MNKKFFLFLASCAFAFLPFFVHAASLEVIDVSGGAQDITEFVGSDDIPTDVDFHLFSGTVGGEYTITLQVQPDDDASLECPVLAVMPGADMIESWTCDAETGEVTIHAEQVEYIGDVPEGFDVFALVFIFAVPEDSEQDGPPAEAAGMWMSTNLSDWEMIPPSDENKTPQFGFRLSGPAGTEGFFKMFLPAGLLDFMSDMAGHEIAVEDLAVFIDDDQASLSVEESQGGALIDIRVTFTDDTTVVEEGRETTGLRRTATSATVTKSIAARERKAVSLAAANAAVEKNGKTTLFGWLKEGRKGQRVTLYQKVGKGKFTEVKSLRTKKNGYYQFTVAPAKATSYKVQYKKKYSPVKKVTVE